MKIILTVLTMIAPLTASAAIVSFSNTRTFSDEFVFLGEGSGELSLQIQVALPQFDPSLGTLNHVGINYEIIDSQHSIVVTNLSNTDTIQFQASDTVAQFMIFPQIPGLGVMPPGLATPPSLPDTRILGPGATWQPALLLAEPQAGHWDQLMLEGFLGNNTVEITESRTSMFGLSELITPGSQENLQTEGIYSVSLRVSVDYTYDPVPEPAGTMLLLASTLTLTLRRRRCE